MASSPRPSADETPADRMAALEERIARIEAQLGIEARRAVAERSGNESAGLVAPFAGTPVAAMVEERGADELEFELGQNWFALAGILALTIGVGFMLSLPHAGLPRGVPSLAGYAVAGALLGLAHRWRRSVEAVAGYLRGAAIILTCVATLRLFFPATRAAVELAGLPGRALLVGSVAFSLWFALRQGSPWLMGLALLTGAASILAAGSAGFVLSGIVAMALLAAAASRRGRWPFVGVAAIPLCAITYLLWALGNPLVGGTTAFVREPSFAPVVLLGLAVIFGLGLFRPPPAADEDESDFTKVDALANCALVYGLFLGHTLMAYRTDFVLLQSVASAAFLAIAVASWLREKSHVGTFFYAMTGYVALSMAILKAIAVPDVFVWLSAQSVVVVATAIWFRSRLIVVANFGIYVLIVLGYVVTAGKENGISLGFGVVALLTARILNWQQHRLELKTELMRNAYLLTAFVLFPYALAFLVPGQLVAVAWVGLALGYYAMNLIVRSQKYRWMGHGTLILATVYLMAAAVRGFEPVYRVLSFLALGAVLLIVSVSFTRARRKTANAVTPAQSQ